jgi:hypothetical protein
MGVGNGDRVSVAGRSTALLQADRIFTHMTNLAKLEWKKYLYE